MPKSSHSAHSSYSSRNELCENNNMETNVSVYFKELNDMRGNLMAVNFTPLPSYAVSPVEQTFSITGTVLMWHVSVCVPGVLCISNSLKLGISTPGQRLMQGELVQSA